VAFASDTRFPDYQESPTFKESGIDLVEAIDRGVGVPPGTPSYVMKKLEAAFLEICHNPDIQAEMKKQGFVPLAMGIEGKATSRDDRHLRVGCGPSNYNWCLSQKCLMVTQSKAGGDIGRALRRQPFPAWNYFRMVFIQACF
jgi:hypothetical protein